MQNEIAQENNERATAKKDVYAIINEKIIEQLNKGRFRGKAWVDAGIHEISFLADRTGY